ncbi:MAG: GNAT family N-acetyltransferase [Oscillospiraceae bacterium]|nr:GNAT family N-acetyltransferase [Oscillospiraceae bacterium]
MTIQHANINDLDEILTLQKLAYQENAARYDDNNIPPLAETLDNIIEQAKSHIILKAVDGGIIIGSVRGREEDGCAVIERLFVHPDYQNLGIGRKLMTAIEQEFNTTVFRLFTGHLDDKNIALYSKLGYSVYGEEEKISPNLSFIHMEKKKEGA